MQAFHPLFSFFYVYFLVLIISCSFQCSPVHGWSSKFINKQRLIHNNLQPRTPHLNDHLLTVITYYNKHKFVSMMASSKGGGGSTKLDTRTVQKTAIKPSYKDDIERDWRLVLHDDTVHTIQQVVEILGTRCPLCAGPRAYEVTLEVHMSGSSTVAVANKKIINEYCKSLQTAGLTVSMSPDDDFEGDEDVDGDAEE